MYIILYKYPYKGIYVKYFNISGQSDARPRVVAGLKTRNKERRIRKAQSGAGTRSSATHAKAPRYTQQRRAGSPRTSPTPAPAGTRPPGQRRPAPRPPG